MSETHTTSQTGTPVGSDDHSLSVGADGAIPLHDRYLVEKLAPFNPERIPERVVHAKGGSAFGEFVVTGDVTVKNTEIRKRAIQYCTYVDASLGYPLRAELSKAAETLDETAESVGVAE